MARTASARRADRSLPGTGPRYGVAYGAEIFAGKVLGDNGSGSDGGIIAGINWAIENQCHIVSMSLGADVASVHPRTPWSASGRWTPAR